MPALKQPDAEPDTVLASLRFIITRKEEVKPDDLKEILTTTYKGPLAREIEDAAAELFVRASESEADAARFFVVMFAMEKSKQISEAGKRALRRIPVPARKALLEELTKEEPSGPVKKTARLLMDMSKTRPPKGIGFWEKATHGERRSAVDAWIETLTKAGEL